MRVLRFRHDLRVGCGPTSNADVQCDIGGGCTLAKQFDPLSDFTFGMQREIGHVGLELGIAQDGNHDP